MLIVTLIIRRKTTVVNYLRANGEGVYMDKYEFYVGKEMAAYEYLGAHLVEGGCVFRTFAPAASGVTVIGDFNDWNDTAMERVYDGHFWECFIPGTKQGMLYKYRIYLRNGGCVEHCDPYGFGMELRPQFASVIRDMYRYQFHDQAWMKQRSDGRDKPVNIYELHAGSWKREEGREGWHTYDELAELLIPYLKEHGYNYIELLPIMEHPCDNSWGYQVSGFYSPTSRYGTADQLKQMVDRLHQNGIGVILDFVPVHFAVDSYGLADYDGSTLYEYPHVDVGASEWGSKNFNHSRGEVRSFLQSCAVYWMKEYHMDGLRVDAISNMIYWQGDSRRGVNHNAVDFLRYMNQKLKEMDSSIMLIAEDSTSYPRVTRPVSEGGLGFDYKWDMGWMNDTLNYFRTAPEYRYEAYHSLTFSMMYYYEERYLCPLSHDEVVHGKATILQKMSGDYAEKFPQARALYLYMYTHPGKKLNFMGNEFGQLREWDEAREQDWNLLGYPIHQGFENFMKRLNRIYLENPAFYEKDYDRDGFYWVECSQNPQLVYAFERMGGGKRFLAVFHFSPEQCNYTLRISDAERLKLWLATDDVYFGGNHAYEGDTWYDVSEGQVEILLSGYSGYLFLIEKRIT